jgi:hypothetical protein
VADTLRALLVRQAPGYEEALRKLTTGWVRPFVIEARPDTFQIDGWPIALRWHRVRPSTNNGWGWRLTFVCPWCRRSNARVLHRISDRSWRCSHCEGETIETIHRRRRRQKLQARRRRLAERREQQAQS